MKVSGSVTFATSDLDRTSATDILFGNLSVGANLVAVTQGNTTDGGVTQDALISLNVTGTSTFTADIGIDQVALLNASGNDFVGAVNFNNVNSGNWLNITIVDATSLTLGNVLATGNLDATAATDRTLAGNVSADTPDLTATTCGINQTSGKLSVSTSPTQLNAATNITLGSATNDFNGPVNAAGENIALTDGAAGMTLGNITAGGTFGATSTGGAIAQASGTTIAVTGETTLAASANGAAADIKLDGTSNDFSTVNADGAGVTLVDANDLTLGTVAATGNLDATAGTSQNLAGVVSARSLVLNEGSAITQSANGVLTVVNGPTNMQAGSTITLDKANDFKGTVNVLGGTDVALNDTDNLTLGNVTATGNLNAKAATDLTLTGDVSVNSLDLTATAGEIDQSAGDLTVTTGSTKLNAANDITLDSPTNDFNGTVNADGAGVTLVDANDLTLGTVTATDDLNLTTTGDLVLGTVTVGGGVSASSNGGTISKTGTMQVE